MHPLHRNPIKTEIGSICPEESFAEALEKLYDSDEMSEAPYHAHFQSLDAFTDDEFQTALRHMNNRRYGDEFGTTLEMIKYGSGLLHMELLRLLNEFIIDGSIPSCWRQTIFRMLPKTGDLTDAQNYRPISILQIFYKIFSQMLYGRLRPLLDAHQSEEQTGFRAGIRIEDALMILETLSSRCSEFQTPLWIASLDLKKAFDRVEHFALFEALRDQGLPEAELAVLLDLYWDQTGSANGSRRFSILRGVKQGDTLSSLLFNAVIENVFRRWKDKLDEHGWQLV